MSLIHLHAEFRPLEIRFLLLGSVTRSSRVHHSPECEAPSLPNAGGQGSDGGGRPGERAAAGAGVELAAGARLRHRVPQRRQERPHQQVTVRLGIFQFPGQGVGPLQTPDSPQ